MNEKTKWKRVTAIVSNELLDEVKQYQYAHRHLPTAEINFSALVRQSLQQYLSVKSNKPNLKGKKK